MSATAGMMMQGIQTLSTFGTQQREATARQQQGAYEQAAYNRNADMADQQAADATARGAVAAGQRGAQVRAETGDARTMLAGQGVDLAQGSAVDVQSNIARLGALDIATIKNNAAREAWGYSTQGTNLRYQGALAKTGADAAAMGMRADAISTLITGAGKTYGLYRQKMDSTGTQTVSPYRTSTDAAARKLTGPTL